MRMSHNWACATLLASALLVLAACGGSGGSSEAPPPPPAPPTALPGTLSVSTAATSEAGVAQAFTASTAATTGLRFEWSFGDGGSSNDAAPSYAYPKAGDYTVGLRVSNSAGESRSASATISVNRVAHLQGLRCTASGTGGWCALLPAVPMELSSEASVHFVDDLNGWAGGLFGRIQRTTDGGRTWAEQDSGGFTDVVSVKFRSATEGYAGSSSGSLRTADGGNTWERLSRSAGSIELVGPTGLMLQSSLFLGTAILVSSFSSADRGSNWVALPENALLRYSAGGTVWGLRDSGGGVSGFVPIWRSADLGRTRTDLTLPLPSLAPSISDLIVFSENTVLVRTRAGIDNPPMNLLTQDSGQSWVQYESVNGTFVGDRSVSGYDSGGFLVTSHPTAGCQASSDYGRTWSVLATPTTRNGGCAVVMADGLLYSDAWISADRGRSWLAAKGLPDGAALHLQPVPRRAGTSTLYRGRWLSRDLGANWIQILPNPSGQLAVANAFAALSPQRLVRLSGGVFGLSVDGGRTWVGTTADIPGAAGGRFQFASPQVGWMFISLSRAPLRRTLDGGQTWTALDLSPTAVHFLDTQRGFAYADGALRITADGGSSWATPAAGAPATSCSAAQFAAGQPPGFFDTPLAIRFFDLNQGVLFDFGGRIWTTSDGGITCTRRTSAVAFGLGAMVATAGSGTASTVWMVNHDGQIQRSDDRGVTWEVVAVQLPAFSNGRWTAVGFADRLNGWLAGSRGRIAATRDGGRTWQAQRSGLSSDTTQIQFIDSRTGWMLGDDGVIVATGTGGN